MHIRREFDQPQALKRTQVQTNLNMMNLFFPLATPLVCLSGSVASILNHVNILKPLLLVAGMFKHSIN